MLPSEPTLSSRVHGSLGAELDRTRRSHHPRAGTGSPLRDSAGIQPDFASAPTSQHRSPAVRIALTGGRRGWRGAEVGYGAALPCRRGTGILRRVLTGGGVTEAEHSTVDPIGAARRPVASAETTVSEELEAPGWDEFLSTTGGGSYYQTAMWSRVKSSIGWRLRRITVTEGGRIVGGAQLLYRPLPHAGVLGNAGYVSKGPVVAPGRIDVASELLAGLCDMLGELRIRYLVLEAANAATEAGLGPHLSSERFVEGSLADFAPATTLVDLGHDEDTLLAAMKKKTRYNIGLGLRRGVQVREGDAADLPAYHAMLRSTAERQGFTPFSEGYYRTIWDELGPSGNARIFVAEVAHEPVAIQFTIPFGDRLDSKMPAWSGAAGNLHPNEVLHWETIRWSKQNGYRYYDFDGIKLDVARAAIAGDPLPEAERRSIASFKLSFGGEVVIRPGTYHHVPNRALAATLARIEGNAGARKLARRVRNLVHLG